MIGTRARTWPVVDTVLGLPLRGWQRVEINRWRRTYHSSLFMASVEGGYFRVKVHRLPA